MIRAQFVIIGVVGSTLACTLNIPISNISTPDAGDPSPAPDASSNSPLDAAKFDAPSTSTAEDARSDAAVTPADGFFDDFSGTALDTARWKIAKRNWGGQLSGNTSYNGGVLPENVSVKQGNAVLEAHGNRYTGNLLGINKDGSTRADGKLVGAAIATAKYFSSGRYEVRMRIVPKLGLCSAMWTFHYEEYYPGNPNYINKPVGGDSYYAINHEIDIELPGRPGAPRTGMTFKKVLLTPWTGENEDEYSTTYADLPVVVENGQFHTFRIDWHTGGGSEAKRVDFYVDDTLISTSTAHIPNRQSRLWIGAWFPREWAGAPDFDTEQLLVEWVKITPFHEPGDQFVPETYPDTGWSDSTP